MREFLILLAANLPSVACVFCAGYMAAKDKQGWGWFLFVSIILVQCLEKKQ